jgi:hypothetical protein
MMETGPWNAWRAVFVGSVNQKPDVTEDVPKRPRCAERILSLLTSAATILKMKPATLFVLVLVTTPDLKTARWQTPAATP